MDSSAALPRPSLAGVPLSILDRSRTRAGETEAETLRGTVRLAQQVEELGYHRFWVSEHHSVPGVVGSARRCSRRPSLRRLPASGSEQAA